MKITFDNYSYKVHSYYKNSIHCSEEISFVFFVFTFCEKKINRIISCCEMM